MRTFTLIILALLLPCLMGRIDYVHTLVLPEADILGDEQRASFPKISLSILKDDKTKQLVASTQVAFRTMDDLRSYMGKEEIRGEMMDELLKNSLTVPLASAILTDNDFARSSYGEDQAIARVYAIELLARKGDLGDITPLSITASHLASVLNRKKEISKGEFRDFEDLLYEYLKRVDLSDVHTNMSTLLQQFHHTPKLSESFFSAFAFALRGKMSDAVLEDLLSRNLLN